MIIIASIAIVKSIAIVPDAIIQSLWRVKINQAWNAVELTVSNKEDDKLHDGVPDGWTIQSWGGARWDIKLDSESAGGSGIAVQLKRTNNVGVVALVQEISIVPNAALVCTIRAKGDESAIQFLLNDPDEGWVNGRWLDIDQDENWRSYRLTVHVPDNHNTVLLRLRSSGLTWFDEAYCSLDGQEREALNLLINPGFEHDGNIVDPLEWWQNHISGTEMLNIPRRYLPKELSYLNIIDMLSGRYGEIQQRAEDLGDDCVNKPNMIGWLLTHDEKFSQVGGAVARERLYQVAIELAPNCPQPYAALAELYQTYGAYGRATELYHRAAELSGNNSLAGKYYFEAGLLHLRYTGDSTQALDVLWRARQIPGWYRTSWYRGASLFYLALAYEEEGEVALAKHYYQGVLSCSVCDYHHDSAQQRLDSLSIYD